MEDGYNQKVLMSELRAMRLAGWICDAERTIEAREVERIVFELEWEIIKLRKQLEAKEK